MMNFPQKIWQRTRDLLPVKGFYFDRPLVLLQSDDWGRVGVRDQEGWDELRDAGIDLGVQPYDFYSMETAEDVTALTELLKQHRDSIGRSPCLEMNFILANPDFSAMEDADFHKMFFLSLADGLPQGWSRPNLVESYRAGIREGVFCAALHGSSHFCCAAVKRNAEQQGERQDLLRTLWGAGTPYIHWRMPWIGYEYWNPELPEDERFLTGETQQSLIGDSVGAFAKLFSTLPRSACAPGYRANDDTHRAWAQHGVKVAQNGPGVLPPHLGRHGILHLTRTVDFEPAADPEFSVEKCVEQAESCFKRGVPALVSLHSINFHSTLRDFRSRTLRCLSEFLKRLESKHADLLYLHDQDIYSLVMNGRYEAASGSLALNVRSRSFIKSALSKRQSA